jgi:uncharacterized membrane protein YedE/YeeE
MRIKRAAASFAAILCGFVFGIGLLVSGMANPAKVLAFLDLSGAWDPTLALVMAGAIAIAVPGFAIAKRKGISVLDGPLRIPTADDIDARLLLGSATFGVGWGLAGFCPGPALVALGMGQFKAIVFVGAMLLGMLTFELLERRSVTVDPAA